MSNRVAPTAPGGGASKPGRRGRACSRPPRGCSPSAASRVPRSRESQRPPMSRPRRSTPPSATSARSSPSSWAVPCGAATTLRCSSRRAPAPWRRQPISVSSYGSSPPISPCASSASARCSRFSRRRARSDPELAELRAKIHGARHSNLGSFVDALRANGPLRLERDAALDDVWALASPELHQLLTGTRGWTRERYCGWLADSLGALLLES